jgi:hypothetical protein
MHTMEFVGGWIAHHNGDFSGDVELHSPGTPTQVTVVPFLIIQQIVAEKVRRDRIAKLEEAGPAELLR